MCEGEKDMSVKLIAMLTNNDKTVPGAVDIFEKNKMTKADCWGFKDIGISYLRAPRRHPKDALRNASGDYRGCRADLILRRGPWDMSVDLPL